MVIFTWNHKQDFWFMSTIPLAKDHFECFHTRAKVHESTRAKVHSSNDGPDHHLNCAFQIMHRDVILRTHGPKYRDSNDHSNCAFQIQIQIAHFCSRVKTIVDSILIICILPSDWSPWQPEVLERFVHGLTDDRSLKSDTIGALPQCYTENHISCVTTRVSI